MADIHTSSQETMEEFAALVRSFVSDGHVTLVIALGIDTGLFDVLVSQDKPKTSQEIAEAGKLRDKYVKELLGDLVSAGIVDTDPSCGTYLVEENHRPGLRKIGKLSRPCMSTRSIPMLSEAYHNVKECFKLDGPIGVPPAVYSHFDSYLSAMNRSWFNKYLVQSFIPTISGLEERLDEGICVLDVCCGEGDASIAMARRFPKSQFYAFDFSEAAIQTAQEKVTEANMKNVHMVCHDAAALPEDWTGKFQYIFSRSGIHDQPQPRNGLLELNRVLAGDGVASILEPECHSSLAGNLANGVNAANLYAFSLMSCMAVSLSFEGSEGLGAVWGLEASTAMLEECGFRVRSVADVQGDISMHLFCHKKEAEPLLHVTSSSISLGTQCEQEAPALTEAEAFAESIDAKTGKALISMTIAIGMEVGLFDLMIALGQPKTCRQIADAGQFKERYVKEWLGAMVTSGIVSVDTSGELETYWVPDHRRSILQKDGELSSIGWSAVSIPRVSEAFYSLVDCFKLDGPLGLDQGKYSQCCKHLPNQNNIWSKFLS